MLSWCWVSIVEHGSTSAQHWANASCLLGNNWFDTHCLLILSFHLSFRQICDLNYAKFIITTAEWSFQRCMYSTQTMILTGLNCFQTWTSRFAPSSWIHHHSLNAYYIYHYIHKLCWSVVSIDHLERKLSLVKLYTRGKENHRPRT